jgi:Transposase
MAGGRLVAQDGDIAEVEAPEEIVAQVAAIDVAKASGMVCTRVPHPAKPGQRATKLWQVPATTNAIIELAEQLACQGIQRVVVESTSDYWRPFVSLLEARGLVVWLVNARDVKHLPGRPDQAGDGGDRHHGSLRAGHAGGLIAGQRDPKVLAELARGRMRGKRAGGGASRPLR